MKMEEISSNGLKTLWEKEKLLVTSNFSFHKCFKRACTETRKKPGLVWERVKPESLTTKREIIRCVRQNSRRFPFRNSFLAKLTVC